MMNVGGDAVSGGTVNAAIPTVEVHGNLIFMT